MNYYSTATRSLTLLVFAVLFLPSIVFSKTPQWLPSTIHLAQTEENQGINNQEKAEQFVDFLINGDYEQARNLLHPDLQAKWSPDQIKQVWSDLLQQTGPVEKRGGSRLTENVASSIVFIDIQFKDMTEPLLVIFNENQEIVGVDFPNPESIEQIATKVLEALVAEDFARARGYLHPYLKTEVFPAEVEEKWRRLIERTGPYQRLLKTQVKPGSDLDDVNVVLLTVEFEKVTDDLIVIFNNQKQITGMDFPVIEN